jgi:hypothetical protein
MFALPNLYDSFVIALKEISIDEETLEVLIKLIVNLSSDGLKKSQKNIFKLQPYKIQIPFFWIFSHSFFFVLLLRI